MDNRTIFSKTGKGALEISKKAIRLQSDERQALLLVDGKSNLAQMEEKLGKPAPRIRAIFDKLIELDLIREFITKGGPDSIIPSPGSPSAAMQVQEITEDDLDFTALAPVASSNSVKEIESRRQAAEAAERQAREAEARRRSEAEKALREAAEKKAREDALLRERARLAEEAKRKADAERVAREAAEQKARAEAEARERARLAEEAKRKAEAERIVREAAEKKAREEAERKAREEAERKAREEAERKAREEAERKAREEAERKAREEAERKAREEAERKAREEAERKAREEAERKAREEAERKAREEAERKAREEAERKAREEAERKAREEAVRRAQELAERQAREHAAARERARQEAELKAREDAERAAREQAEAQERARQEEELERRRQAEEKARLEAEAKARQQAEARERARQEEEALRRRLAEDKAREEAQRKAAADAERQAREAAEAREREAQAALARRQADEEAARYTAALSPHLEAASPAPGGMPDFNTPAPADEPRPAPMGAFANMAALESGAANTSVPAQDDLAEPEVASAPVPDKDREKEREKLAKERAKEEARARKEAEKEAKRLARESRASSARSLPAGKIIAGVLVLVLGGAAAFVLTAGADKPAIEKALTARFGTAVTVADAKFSHFPAQLKLTNVAIGDIKLPQVVAIPETASLLSGEKIWKSADITGMSLDAGQAQRLAVMLATEPSRSAGLSLTVQRVRALGVNVSGTAVPVPKFDATASLNTNGSIKQVTLALPDGKAQVLLAPEDKGWSVDFDSRGVTWPIGPKAAWDSLRAKGVANAEGIRFEEFVATLGGGNLRGTANLGWSGGWKLSGAVELGGVEAEALGAAIYGASPLAGAVEGKFNFNLAADALPRLFDAPQVDGSFLVSRAVIKGYDLARLVQGADPTGQTRVPELTGALNATGGRLQLRSLRGSAGILNLVGSVDVGPDRSLAGSANLELGAGGSRGRTTVRLTGTVAEPRLAR